MTIRRHGRPDAQEADRLLGSGFGDVAVDGVPLAGLLAAATAPARPGEFAGEDAALAAFRAARLAPGHIPPTRTRRRWRRAAGTAWIAVAATTATAGVAVAAGIQHRERSGPPALSAPARRGNPDAAAGAGATRSDGSPSGAAGPTSTGLPQAVDPQAVGLCRGYLAKDREERGKSLQTPAYRALVIAAGGADQVDAFCALVQPTPSEHARPSPERSRAATPESTTRPTGKRSE